MNGKICQIEVDVTHPRVLPVHDVDDCAVIDQVGLPEVIVAGLDHRRAAPQRGLDLSEAAVHRVHIPGQRRALFSRHAPVVRERVER